MGAGHGESAALSQTHRQLLRNISTKQVGLFWGFINVGNGAAKDGASPTREADIAVGIAYGHL
jgi:hypothetical protein